MAMDDRTWYRSITVATRAGATSRYDKSACHHGTMDINKILSGLRAEKDQIE